MSKTVEVLLIKDYYHLGKAGEKVKVAQGFARNYLIPQKIALPLSEGLLKTLEEQKKLIQRKILKQRENSIKIKEKIENQRVTIKLPTGKDGKLFQALTKEKISQLIEEKLNLKVDKHSIKLEKPIKSTGIFQIELFLPGEIKTSFELEVES